MLTTRVYPGGDGSISSNAGAAACGCVQMELLAFGGPAEFLRTTVYEMGGMWE